MGVRRAVDIVLDIARKKGARPVYTYGQLIHNPQTVELLRKQGIVPVSTIDEIDGGVVVIRAHGISPQERALLKAKGATIVDATCPKVARVQAIIKKHAREAYHVIIVGDGEHPEVSGLLGYAGSKGIVLGEGDDASGLPPLDKVCVVAQTTQNAKRFDEVAGSIVERFPHAVIFNTICDSTERRQAEIKKMTSEIDAMVIVGGKNSANTQRLADIARSRGTPAFHIETADELRHIDLAGADRIGISAGASTPNWITDSVIEYLTFHLRGKKQRKMEWVYSAGFLAVQTDLYSALGAASLTMVSMFLQGLRLNVLSMSVAALYVYAMHTINRLQDRHLGRITGGFRDEIYIRHRKGYMTAAVCALFLALMLSAALSIGAFICLFVISLLGVLYNVVVFPRSLKVKRLRDIPGSKNIFTAAAWGIVTAFIPAMEEGNHITPTMVCAFLFVSSIVFVKSALSDMVEVQSDRLVGRETIPVVMGEAKARGLIKGIALFLAVMIIAAVGAGYVPMVGTALLISVFYIWICLELCDKRAQFSNAALEGLFGTNYIIAGVSVVLWFHIGRFFT